jgi:putative ABC transport system substrate-binding protein
MVHATRRQFITLLGGAAMVWPRAARAQQPYERVRRIGALMNLAGDDPESPIPSPRLHRGCKNWAGLSAVMCGSTHAGRRAISTALGNMRRNCSRSRPDVILASGTPSVAALQRATRSVPIVFANVVDPVGSGFVASLARPDGNTTGFSMFEYSISGKWLELLKEVAPRVTRVAVLRDPALASGGGQLGALQAVASSFGVELSPVGVRDAGEIERTVPAFARGVNGGLIVTGSTLVAVHRDLIVTLAARHQLPAVYPFRYFVTSGGLISYGPDSTDPFRRAASYVDRILKGEKPGDLPVQAATKFELVINLNTAKALGLEVPATLLARADEVIE